MRCGERCVRWRPAELSDMRRRVDRLWFASALLPAKLRRTRFTRHAQSTRVVY
jgi:hypothetical protein